MAKHLPSFYICDINENSAVPWRIFFSVIHKSVKSSLSDILFLKSTIDFFYFVLESNPVLYSGSISSSIGCAVTWFVYTLFVYTFQNDQCQSFKVCYKCHEKRNYETSMNLSLNLIGT